MRKDAFRAWSGHVIVGNPISASRGGHDVSLSRYAVYAMPDPASPLFLRASRWLGWDSVAAAMARFPEQHELDNPGSLDIELITRTPRKYGFHGTVKPPMRLAEGYDGSMLIARAGELAAELAPVTIPAMDITEIGSFLALAPSESDTDLAELAENIVTGLDEFRQPADAAEMEKRRAAGLSARQDELLRIWGYPYVLDGFRFHMTLSGRLDPDKVPMVRAMLAQWIGPVIPEPFILDRLAVMGEAADGRFRLVSWLPLGFRG